MKRMIMVGAGGLGREIAQLAKFHIDIDKKWFLGGFLDSRERDVIPHGATLNLLGDPRTYEPNANDIFVAAIGDPRLKRRLIAPLLEKGGVFVGLRTMALMSERVRLGCSVIGEGARISVDCSVGDYAFVGAESILGHDVVVADYAHVGARCFFGGGVRVGEHALVHPMSSVAAGVHVGEGAVVALGAVVFKDVPAGVTVAGNPARLIARFGE